MTPNSSIRMSEHRIISMNQRTNVFKKRRIESRIRRKEVADIESRSCCASLRQADVVRAVYVDESREH